MPVDELNEECGVFAISNHSDPAYHCALGLHALQHRGQESHGIVTSDGLTLHQHHSVGGVFSVIGGGPGSSSISNLSGNSAIGHVRYSTSGGKLGAQPIYAKTKFGEIAVAHNGNLINTKFLREGLVAKGCILQSDIDTEVIVHLIATSEADNLHDALIDTLNKIKGAYSLVILTKQTIYGIRDPAGVRPLSLGMLNSAHILASETCALDIIGATFIREIQPGEVVTIENKIDGDEITSFSPLAREKSSFCIFEYVYFSRPDSIIDTKSVYEVRKKIGKELAVESPPPSSANVVVPVPDSGVPAALGFAQYTGLPFELGIIRNHYVGRTFIQPTDLVRQTGVKLKHNANIAVIHNRNIILVDDSIVRGTTLKSIVALLKNAGAKSVHLRISSPPTVNSCFYGIDTPKREKLMAVRMSIEEMRGALGVESLCFLSIDGLYRAVHGKPRDSNMPQSCDACFTGYYPLGK